MNEGAQTPNAGIAAKDDYNFNAPETAVFKVTRANGGAANESEWQGWTIEQCNVTGTEGERPGALSWQQAQMGMLDLTLMSFVDCPQETGWFAVDEVTGEHTTDDIEFYAGATRKATNEEIACA